MDWQPENTDRLVWGKSAPRVPLTHHMIAVGACPDRRRTGRPVIQDFTLIVPPGKKAALVGATGGGKRRCAEGQGL